MGYPEHDKLDKWILSPRTEEVDIDLAKLKAEKRQMLKENRLEEYYYSERRQIMPELEPIDPTRCQAEVKEGSFMTFGPRKYKRCENKPSWIAVDVREGLFEGAMSLCEECKKVCKIRVPSASFQKIKGGEK